MGVCALREGVMKEERFLRTRKPHRHNKWEALNLRVECNVREQNRKFTTEIAAEHHFSAKRWLTKPPHRAEVRGGVPRSD